MSHFYWIAEEMTGDEEGDREGEWQAAKLHGRTQTPGSEVPPTFLYI